MAEEDILFDAEGPKKEPIPISELRQEEKPKEVEVDIKKKITDNKAPYDIKTTNFVKDFVQQSSNSSNANQPKEPVADIRARLESDAKEEVSNMKVEDFEPAAGVIVDVLDISLLFFIRWYSMDKSDAEYKVPEEKLKKLKTSLAPFLMQIGKKFPLGWLLLLGVVAIYATPIRKAHENRILVKSERARKKMSSENKSSESEEDDNPKYVPLKKKKQGGQAK